MRGAYQEILEKYRQGDYLSVLHGIRNIENTIGIIPNLLIIKGICIQLNNDDISSSDFTLDMAKKAFQDCIALEPHHIEAYIELAWFELNINNDASRAIHIFSKARDLAQSQLVETINGAARCISEIESSQGALDYLAEAESLAKVKIKENDKLILLKDELHKMMSDE